MSTQYDLSSVKDLPIIMGQPDGAFENFTVGDVDVFYTYAVEVCIINACQLGACLMLLVVVAIVTNSERRRTPMFALNIAALLLNFLKLLLACLYFTSDFNEAYVYFSGDYSIVPTSAFAASVAAVVLSLMLVICIVVCLTMQVHVVLVTMPGLYRSLISFLSILIALCVVAFRFAYAVINIKTILGEQPDSRFDGLTTAKTVVTALAVLWYSAVFTMKLAHTVVRRRSMGVKKLGAVEILLIMGGQTLIIPAVFAIVQFLPTGLPIMDTNVLTLVTIFMPLSSIWASSIVEGRRATAELEMRPLATASGRTYHSDGTFASASWKLKSIVVSKLRAGADDTCTSLTSADSSIEARVKRTDVGLERQGF